MTDPLRAALERIAGQGLGRWSQEHQTMMGATGEPWLHWAAIAEDALAANPAPPERVLCACREVCGDLPQEADHEDAVCKGLPGQWGGIDSGYVGLPIKGAGS